MNTIKKVTFTRNNVNCTISAGDAFSKDDLENLNRYYESWKALNEENRHFNMRRANLPELLSEGLASALFGWIRTNATSISGCHSSSCDLVDTKTGELIQLKACSTTAHSPAGPTSFGPKTEFDTLIFMHLDCEKNTASFYKLDATVYKSWMVNSFETIADQQAQGRRPRVVILDKIKKDNLQPFYVHYFK